MMVNVGIYRPVAAYGGANDTHLSVLTFHFRRRNGRGALFPVLSAKWMDGDRMFLSEFDGIYYPVRRQTTDGEGRTVADTQRTDRPRYYDGII